VSVTPLITDDAQSIARAKRVIIPGVGAAPFAMKKINSKGLTPVLQSLTQPVMGICLGMQLIFETLEEGGVTTKGLGLVPGRVEREYAYFVHSFAAPVSDATLAKSTYGTSFSAIVRHKNVYGCQFHPERSSHMGAQIFRNFLKAS